MDQGQTYNPKCNLKQLPNETIGFSWDGSTHSTHSTHNTTKFCDWSVSNQEQIALLETFHQYLDQNLPFPNEILTIDKCTHT